MEIKHHPAKHTITSRGNGLSGSIPGKIIMVHIWTSEGPADPFTALDACVAGQHYSAIIPHCVPAGALPQLAIKFEAQVLALAFGVELGKAIVDYAEGVSVSGQR